MKTEQEEELRKAKEYSMRDILLDILKTLQEMKQQEKEYWDTWKDAKQKEIKKE